MPSQTDTLEQKRFAYQDGASTQFGPPWPGEGEIYESVALSDDGPGTWKNGG